MSRTRTLVPVLVAASIALGAAPAVASTKTPSAVPLAPAMAVGADRGEFPLVRLYDAITGQQRSSFLAYPADFRGGVRIARGDVDGDGVADVITGPGPGAGPQVKVFSGADGHLLRSFLAFSAIGNGLYVAAGDVNADRRADVIVGADAGGAPHVKVFDGATGVLRSSLYAYGATFSGGVRVAAGDVDGDTRADVITGTGPGAGAHVKVFSGATGVALMSFLPFGPSSSIGGVRVAAGQVDRDGRADVITGAGPGGGPHIKVFSGANGSTLSSFLAGAPGGGAVFVAG